MSYELFKKCAQYLTDLKVARGHKSTGYWSRLFSKEGAPLFFKKIFFFRKVDTVVLTYSTFKRHLRDDKYLDPIVDYVINEVDQQPLVLEKNQRFLRFLPAFHESNEVNVVPFLIFKSFSTIIALFLKAGYRLLSKPTSDMKFRRLYIETYMTSYYFMLQFWVIRPKQVFFASQFSIDSMAICIACNRLKIKCSEIQHGNIIKTSPLYNFSYELIKPEFFAHSFVVKNEVVKKTLLESGRAMNEKDVVIMPSSVRADESSDSLLICLGIIDVPNTIDNFLNDSQFKKVIIRPHPGFRELDLSSFENLSSLLKRPEVEFSNNNSIENDLGRTSSVLTGSSTVIIDGCTSGHKIYTWDKRSLEQYQEYKTLINLI